MVKLSDLKLHAKNILIHNYKIMNSNKVLIIYDTNCKLNVILKDAFEAACNELSNEYVVVNYHSLNPEELVTQIDSDFKKDDIVVLIQTTSFRVSKFRWRNELCSRGLKVVEFGQLGKILEDEFDHFIDSLTYDFPHYKKVSEKLVPLIENAKSIKIICEDGSEVMYSGPMDRVIKNDGNFEGHTNYGSRFPIGEILSEGLDLSSLSGKVQVYAYPNLDQKTTFVTPFNCVIENGFLVSHDGPQEFSEIINLIKTEHPEGKVYVREFGLGINRNIPRMHKTSDPIAYERQEGLHFSLGMKHGIYGKKLKAIYGKKFLQRFHIDIYINVLEIFIREELIYQKDQGFLV